MRCQFNYQILQSLFRQLLGCKRASLWENQSTVMQDLTNRPLHNPVGRKILRSYLRRLSDTDLDCVSEIERLRSKMSGSLRKRRG